MVNASESKTATSLTSRKKRSVRHGYTVTMGTTISAAAAEAAGCGTALDRCGAQLRRGQASQFIIEENKFPAEL